MALAEAYYTAMSKKNVAELEQYLHPDVRFIGPLAELTGKDAVLEATRNFVNFFNTLTIRAKFGSDQQAVIVYDLDFPAPIGHLPATVLMSFQEGLVVKIELFYDARPFERKKSEIFS